jgi:hypothetical protein
VDHWDANRELRRDPESSHQAKGFVLCLLKEVSGSVPEGSVWRNVNYLAALWELLGERERDWSGKVKKICLHFLKKV